MKRSGYFYRLPTNLCEGDVFSHARLFTAGKGGFLSWTSFKVLSYEDPALSPAHMGSYQYGDHPWPCPQTCSNLFTLESGRLALDWKAFFYK